jgi:hypothetical protein
MTHDALKQPLGKSQENVLAWLPVISLFILRAQAWARRVWAAMINETPHHGAGLLMSGDSLQGQRSLAKVLGGDMEKAMIVQKLHEWLEFNKAEGNFKNKRDGCWWTYNSYVDWCKEHFDWMSDDKFGRHIRALEKLGVIRTRQMKTRDRKKWYTVDYGKLHSLARTAGESLALMPARVRRDRSTPNAHRAPVNSHRADLHDDSSSKPIKKTNAVTQEKITPPHTPDAARLEPLTLTEESKGADSDSHASGAAEVIGQREEMGGSDLVETTPPGSEAPPIDPAVANVWAMAHNQMCHILGKADPALHLKETALRGHRCVAGVDTYTIAVKNAYAQDQLQHRYYRNVERFFTGVSDQPVKIEFEVDTCHTT